MALTPGEQEDLYKALNAIHEALAAQRPEPNLFRNLSIAHDEVRQSAWVAMMLNHGALGPALVGELLNRAGMVGAELAPGPYVVTTEYAGSHSQVDIVVHRQGAQGFVLFIENKIHAGLTQEQLDRESLDLEALGRSLRVPEERQRRLVLSNGDPKRKDILTSSPRRQPVGAT